MWLEAGPTRTAAGLEDLLAWLESQSLSNPVAVSTEIARAALGRRDSVGSHIRTDEEAACTTLPITH